MKIKWFSGIRVTGLLLVLTYHFFKKYFPGGFIGVDLFFTFSGYLVTAVFLDEFSKSGSIDLKRFAGRRLYRILPPLVLTILLSLPFALLVRRDFLANIGRQIGAALGFVTNYFEILTGGNYEAQFAPHLFVHTWSLAIEVQFYIFWGMLIWLLSKSMKRLNRLRGTLFLLSLSLFVITYVSMVAGSFLVKGYSSIYFSSLTHVFPFFLGACLATLIGLNKTTKLYKELAANVTDKHLAGMILGSLLTLLALGKFLDFNHIISYILGFLLSSLATIVLIVACRLLSDWTPESVQEPKILTILADLSYGVYLFHWPLYTVFSQLLPNILAVILTLVFSLIGASLSFYIVEPWLAGKTPQVLGLSLDLNPHRQLIWRGTGVLSLIVLGIIATAPARGEFETQMLVDSLNQAASQLQQTRQQAGQKRASKYEILDGITIIGDSVTLRASTALAEALPGAVIDAQGSRNLMQANEIVANHIANGSLTKYVVIGTGVNIVYNYEEELDKLVADLPKGYHLILITPYDGNSATYDNPVAHKTRAYELELAEKHPFITLADWHQTALDNPDIWVGSDHIHFGGDGDGIVKGAELYAQTVKAALKKAEGQPVKE